MSKAKSTGGGHCNTKSKLGLLTKDPSQPGRDKERYHLLQEEVLSMCGVALFGQSSGTPTESAVQL